MKKTDRKGSVLAMVLILMVILTVMGQGLLYQNYTNAIQTDNAVRATQAFWLAEAGLARGIVQLRNGDNTTPIGPTNVANGNYSVAFTPPPVNSSLYTIMSTATCGSVTRRLRLQVFQRSFAQWAYFSNSEYNTDPYDPPNRWMFFHSSAQIIEGPFHTNGRLNIELSANPPAGEGNPVFLSSVTFSGIDVNGPWNRVFYSKDYNNEVTTQPTYAVKTNIFQGGLPSQVVSISPAADPLLPIKTKAAESGGLTLTSTSATKPAAILFKSDGTVNYSTWDTFGKQTVVNNQPLPANGAIYVNGANLNVSGTVNGKVTVGAAGNIIIVGDLMYPGDRYSWADADLTKRNIPKAPGDNMLGLVAVKNVYLDKPGTGNDLTIDAYIVAQDKYFKYPVPGKISYRQGRLTVFGGIMQKERGAVKSGDGYTKNYHYDPRMSNTGPSHFVALKDANGRTVYAKKSWQEI